MTAYFEVAAAFTALGAYVFFLYRCWYKRLVRLAGICDAAERRRRASREYLGILVLLAVPVVLVLVGMLLRTSVSRLLILFMFLSCLAPAIIWWTRRMRELAALGYGRQR